MFLIYFFPTHFFQGPSTEILETFPYDVALIEKEALLCQFPESVPNKNETQNTQISPNFAFNRNILSVITRNVEKIENRKQ